MKKLLMLFVIGAIFASCSNENDPIVNETGKTISGVFNYGQSQTIELDGKKITLLSEGMNGSEEFDENQIVTKAESPFMYASIPTYTTPYKNTKILINGAAGLSTGSYVCDVYSFNTSITMPSNAYAAVAFVPSPAAYSNYSNQTVGINWTMSSSSSGVVLSISFYTILVKYDMLGRAYNWLIPLDGRTVQVPYKFIY